MKECQTLPEYFRQMHRLYQQAETEDAAEKVCEAVRMLVQNNVSFGSDYTDDTDDYQYFLCGELDDKDLPWDLTEEDW